MGMSKEQKAMYAQMTALLAQMQNPKTNPAQEFLTGQAIEGANFLKKGDYSQLPKGMYWNFQMPSQQNEMYKKYANVNQGGTFALSSPGGAGARTQAQNLQGQYLKDKFARDASQNYQNNISDAATNIRSGLGQASGYQTNQNSAVMNAMGNMYGMLPQKTSPWGQILGIGAGVASSFI